MKGNFQQVARKHEVKFNTSKVYTSHFSALFKLI